MSEIRLGIVFDQKSVQDAKQMQIDIKSVTQTIQDARGSLIQFEKASITQIYSRNSHE